MEVAPGVHRLGSRWVNWYLLKEDAGLTVIDTGLPAQRSQLPALVATIGKTLPDVKAVILTHWHADHVGCAQWIRAETGADVWGPEGDAPIIRGEEAGHRPNFLPYLWRPTMVRYLASVIRAGALRIDPVKELATFKDGDELDVPGRPRVIATPGHTAGHCSLLVRDRGILFGGDALATLNPLTWKGSPRPMPGGVNDDNRQVLESLRKLEQIEAGTLLTGHGEPWTQGAAEAARLAHDAGVP